MGTRAKVEIGCDRQPWMARVAYLPLCLALLALPARLPDAFWPLPDALCFTFGGFALRSWPFALLGGDAVRGFALAARDGVAGAKRPIGVCDATDSIGTGSAEGLDDAGASNLTVTAVYTTPTSTPRRTATRQVVIQVLQLTAPPPIRVVRAYLPGPGGRSRLTAPISHETFGAFGLLGSRVVCCRWLADSMTPAASSG